jgi:4-hydroxybenzoyl-CoA thioesterase
MPFSMPVTLRFAQCDTSGGVHYPRYMEMMNDLIEAWFLHRLDLDFHTFHLTQRLGLPVLTTRLDILAPSRIGEVVDVTLRVEQLGRTSVIVTGTGQVNGSARFRVRHKLVFISLESYRAVPIPDALMPRLQAEQTITGAHAAPGEEPALPVADRPPRHHLTRIAVRTSHCDPAGIVFYARYFEMLAEAAEDWFDRGLLLPLERLASERGLRLVITGAAAGFERVSRLSDPLEVALWVSEIDGDRFTLSMIVCCGTEIRLRARLEAVLQSRHDAATAALPDDLREWMGRYLSS